MNNGLPFTILVVEDDQDDREIIDDAFKEVGYEAEVKKFKEGQALLRYLEQIDRSGYPSLIVLDNSLPDLMSKIFFPFLSRISVITPSRLLSIQVLYQVLKKSNLLNKVRLPLSKKEQQCGK